jgi:hypothetical protein
MMHTLTNKDFDNLTADCAVCGPVEMIRRSDKGYLCKPKRLADQKKYRDNYRQNKGARLRNRTMDDGFSYTADEKQSLYDAQEGKCGICGEWFAMLEYDHCHDSLTGRGLLCHKCNTALGMFDDDLSKLESAVRYMRRFNLS